MRVLVLRPAKEAEGVGARLAALGHEPVLAPLLEIVPTRVPAPPRTYAVLVATSSHALRLLNSGFDALLPLPLFVVGERTARAARARGFLNVGAVAKDVVSLLAFLLASSGAPGRVLYLAGRPRKAEIETGLARAGRDLDVLVVYEARALGQLPTNAEAAIGAGRLDAALHYSERSAALFLELVHRANLGVQASRLIHAVISEQASAPLRGFARDLRVASNPDEASLLAMLEKKS